jgi:hypothetical protein
VVRAWSPSVAWPKLSPWSTSSAPQIVAAWRAASRAPRDADATPSRVARRSSAASPSNATPPDTSRALGRSRKRFSMLCSTPSCSNESDSVGAVLPRRGW